ncbi:Glycosyltransferase involved in cell wall bisynthesis [Devosia enhydra]|uniref:Glycosyltransferase involved in cell wall bisynthesis n=1 Tax=Devosia enhydra TaxID=665118 RepID=A0A1K2HY49_9HYPH|nr:Glycosyltransferase involved in cell wall bisynthesis [Devosia enhydra]
MKRIVLATDSAQPSGMGEHMLTLGAALSGFDITLACPEGEAGRALLRKAALAGLAIKAIDLDRLDRFGTWIRAAAIDLVHVHAGIGWEGHDLVRVAKAAGVPVVRTEHLPYLLTSPVQQAQYRAMLMSVDRRIAVSDAVAASHEGTGPGRHYVVRNGLSPRLPSRPAEETRQRLGLAPTDTVLLSVARLTPQKDHMALIDAAPRVLARHKGAKFIFVGSGSEAEAVGAAIAARGLGDSIRLLGHRDDVPDLLAIANLFILPSRFEGLSLALLEAMAAGVPALATAVGGNLEALGQSHPLQVPPGDSDALAGAILRAIEDKALASAAARGAQARFQAGFAADRMAAETAAIYLSLPSISGTRP